jgi:hypothetical protein
VDTIYHVPDRGVPLVEDGGQLLISPLTVRRPAFSVTSPAALEVLSRRVGAELNSWVAWEIIVALESSRPTRK